MKNVMKHIAMIALVIALAAGGYMAYQHYYGAKEEVKVQFLNFGGEYDGYHGPHRNSSYNRGYADGMRDCQNS